MPTGVAAQVVTVEAPGISQLQDTISAGSNVISASRDTRDILETWVLKPLALALGRAAIQSITQSTVNWINSGFDGSPAFATDLRTNLRRLGDGVARDFLTNLSNDPRLSSPFIDNIVEKVGATYLLYSGREGLRARLQDTLSQSSRDAASFRAGNFSEGGWGAYFSTFANDANNPIGAHMIASNALAGRISAAAEERVQELAWGSGFMAWKGDCIQPASPTTNTVGGGAVATSLSDAEECLNRETVTPGSFFENKLNITTDSPLRQLELAQSIDAIVGALAQQLISAALGGRGGLRGASQPSQGGGPPATSGGTNTGLISSQDGLATAIQTSIKQVTAWESGSQTILTAAKAANSACATNPAALADPVEPALTSSTDAVTRAGPLLATLKALLSRLQESASETETFSYSSYLAVVSGYQGLLNRDELPSATDMTKVASDAKNSGTSPFPSLYTRLTTLATNGCLLTDAPAPTQSGG